MEKIAFEKYESTTELSDYGTLAEQIGAKGTAMFVPKNFTSTKLNDKGERIRVVVIAGNEAGETAPIVCSAPLSAQLRKLKEEGVDKDEILAMVLDLPIYGNEIGQFIGVPAGERTEAKTVAALKKVKKSGKAVLNLEELVW